MSQSFRSSRIALFAALFLAAAVGTASAQSALPRPGTPEKSAPQTAPAPSSTDRRPPPWWRDDKIKAGIQLTPAQTDSIQRIFDSSIPGQRVIYTSIMDAQKAVDVLLSQDKPDIASSIVAMQQLEMARFNLSVSRDLMLLRMRQVLSPAQRKTLAAIDPEVNFSPKRQ